MKKITFLFLLLGAVSHSQSNLDFEGGSGGAEWNWIVDQNGSNPPLEFVANPNITSENPTSTVAKFTATPAGETYALAYTDDIGSITFTEQNSIIKIKVLKTVTSSFGLKFEIPDGINKEVLVTNTITNGEWEELTFDFSSVIGNTYSRMVIIPDFLFRASDHVVYIDEITFNSGGTANNYNLEDIDFEPNGVGDSWQWNVDQNTTNPPLEFVSNPNTTGINSTATCAKFTATNGAQPWALVYTDNIGDITFTPENTTITMMVLKSFVSNVELKFEAPGYFKNIQVSNSITNGDWEELTFDFSSEIGVTVNRMVIVPDFSNRTQENIVYFDQLSFGTETASTNDFTQNNIKMYPNPAHDSLNFTRVSSSPLQVAIYDVLGKKVLTAADVLGKVDISALNTGLYIVKLAQDNNIISKKLVVK